MTQNNKSTKYKSIYFARLENAIFDVLFEPDYRDFFLDDDINSDLSGATFPLNNPNRGASTVKNTSKYFQSGEPLYIRSMSYGNYAYLAVESEYSFFEVKNAIEGTFNMWKIDAGAKVDRKTVDILSKSSVTLMISGKAKNSTNTNETYWATSLDKLVDIFTVKYTENYIGAPTFIEIRKVLKHTTYIPRNDSSTATIRRPMSPRPTRTPNTNTPQRRNRPGSGRASS
ncbi:hypothetical protein ACFSQ3_07580 [Sphingobacterium corticis]|uniref:Uncharacterized protein n=1 Tax=Sphingobacterium corticis TaxID=1812823 RepID=A0ABW5NIS0_9SPHI